MGELANSQGVQILMFLIVYPVYTQNSTAQAFGINLLKQSKKKQKKKFFLSQYKLAWSSSKYIVVNSKHYWNSSPLYG